MFIAETNMVYQAKHYSMVICAINVGKSLLNNQTLQIYVEILFLSMKIDISYFANV